MQVHYQQGEVPLVLMYSDDWAHLFCICKQVKWVPQTNKQNLIDRLHQEHFETCPRRADIRAIEVWPINVDKLHGT